MTDLVVATRSAHKLREIDQLLGSVPAVRVLDLHGAGIPESDEEESIEAFDSFEENALAKGRYFAQRTSSPVLADDSGLCVDALGGAPGVYSKRFSGRQELAGTPLDLANNAHLLEALQGIPRERRTAHYVCVLALVHPSGRHELFRGTVDGVILEEPRGRGGFGYDPLFFVPSLSATFAEVPADEKNQISHRARALEAALPALHKLASRS